MANWWKEKAEWDVGTSAEEWQKSYIGMMKDRDRLRARLEAVREQIISHVMYQGREVLAILDASDEGE